MVLVSKLKYWACSMKTVSNQIHYFALFAIVFLFVPSCSSVSTDQRGSVKNQSLKSLGYKEVNIKALLDTEEIEVLSKNAHSLVRCVTELAFRQIRSELENRAIKYTCFVKINGKNPELSIIAGLGDDQIKMKPASMGKLKDGLGLGSVYDPQADLAELLSVKIISMDDIDAILEISFYHGPLAAHGYTGLFLYKNGKWEFIKATRVWIS